MPHKDRRERNDYHREYQRGWRTRNRSKFQLWSAKNRAKRFGYTPPSFSAEELDKYRKGHGRRGCEICGRRRKLVTDHDHKTGEFRGFLCHQCNTALGHFADNPKLMEKAANYVRSRA